MEDLKQKLRGKIACKTFHRTGLKNENILIGVNDREINDYAESITNNFNPQTAINASLGDTSLKKKNRKLLKKAINEGYNKDNSRCTFTS